MFFERTVQNWGIVKYWREAFSMFSKRELLLFVFSWFKTFKRALFTFVKYFWWLIPIEIIFKSGQSPLFMGLTTLVMLFSLYLSILSIRASVEQKNIFYFVQHIDTLASFALLYGSAVLVLFFFIALTTGISWQNWPLSSHLGGMNLVAQSIIALLLALGTFFLIDTPHRRNSPGHIVSHAYKGLSKYLPIFGVLTFLYISIYYLVSSLLALLPYSLPLSLGGISLLNFFFTCAISVIYLKIRHYNLKIFS